MYLHVFTLILCITFPKLLFCIDSTNPLIASTNVLAASTNSLISVSKYSNQPKCVSVESTLVVALPLKSYFSYTLAYSIFEKLHSLLRCVYCVYIKIYFATIQYAGQKRASSFAVLQMLRVLCLQHNFRHLNHLLSMCVYVHTYIENQINFCFSV